jgi:two-component system response regulator (stage 0 sporulation protein F)
MTGQEKGFKQPLACWVTHHKDLKQSVGLFFLGCPFSKASFMRLSTATVHRTTKPWRGGQGDTPMATILVIDDEEPIRALLRIALEGAGHEVLEASNGGLGLALYRARAADLIITDLVMPEMDGLEMMLELTRNFFNVKVIAISAGLEGEVPLHVAKLLGARQTFQKPIDMETLLSAVRYELAH